MAFIVFCLLSSATYLLNDVRDRKRDRLHPRKRRRPIASGELSPPRALRIAAMMSGFGLVLALIVRPALALVAITYLLLTTSYSLWWRHVVLVDIVVIAAGFLLRAVAGGVAAGVPLSRSFLIVASACALFLVAGKRYAELGSGAGRHARITLGGYSRRYLRLLLSAAAGLACLAYARWAFSRPSIGPWFELSMVPFVIWLGRYRMLLGSGAGEAPEELILHDPTLLALGALWAMLFAGGVHGAH